MNKQDFSKSLNILKADLMKHSPEILVGIGVTGFCTSLATAIFGTSKAEKLIAKEQEKQEDELSFKDKFKTAWKCYIPMGLFAMSSICCVITSTSINLQRNTALAAAYSLTESALKDYKIKAMEQLGPKKESKIRSAIVEDKMSKTPIDKDKIIFTGKGTSLCFDATSGRYFMSDINDVKAAINNLNNVLLSENELSLNEFYDEIGLPRISGNVGDVLGWNIDRGLIDVHYDAVLSDYTCFDGENKPCIGLSYDVGLLSYYSN